jgi:hypothetical protein
MMKLLLSAVVGLVLLMASTIPIANAAEFIAEAEVIRSEPIFRVSQRRSLAPECAVKPSERDLVTLLNWDLGTGRCAAYQRDRTITGYRVFYRWDDRVFSQEMQRKPGEWIPVSVRIDQ